MTSPIPQTPTATSKHYYHNGTGSRNLRPCIQLCALKDTGQIKISPSGWSNDKYITVPAASVFHKNSAHISWSQIKNHVPRPEITEEHFAKMLGAESEVKND